MRLNEITFTDAKPIEGYGPGFFRIGGEVFQGCLLYTSPSPRDLSTARMPSSA